MENCQARFVKKIQFYEGMHLTDENDFLLTNCEEVAKQLNNFSVNAVNCLNIPSRENFDFLAEKS